MKKLKFPVFVVFLISLCLAFTGCSESYRVGKLIKKLDHKDYFVRSEAADELGEIGDTRSIAPLIRVLEEDENSDVRASAADALGKIGDTRAVAPLIRVLEEDENSNVRALAADILGKIMDKRAVVPLIEALGDESSYVQKNAAVALGKIRDTRAIEPMVAALGEIDEKYVSDIAEQLIIIGAPAVNSLIAALGKPYSSFSRIAEVLRKIGTPAVEPLIAALENKEISSGVAEILGMIGDHRAIDALIELLQDKSLKDQNVRKKAAGLLSEMDEHRVSEFLIELLKNRDLEIVAHLHKYFILKGIPQTENILIEALNKSNDPSMAEALLGSGNARLENAAENWLSWYEMAEPIAYYSADVDKDIGYYTDVKWGNEEEYKRLLNNRRLANSLFFNDSLIYRNSSLIDVLIELLQDERLKDERWRSKRAAYIFMPVPEASWLDERALWLDAKSIRERAAYILSKIDDRRVSEFLIELLKNRDLEIVAHLHEYFILKGIPQTENILIEALFKSVNHSMARAFFNCGNEKLEDEAELWYSVHPDLYWELEKERREVMIKNRNSALEYRIRRILWGEQSEYGY